MKWQCEQCNFTWNFPVSTCIRCKMPVKKYTPQKYIVKGTTEVLARSLEHNEVPYNVLLLEDNNGMLHLSKNFQKYEIGHEVLEDSPRDDLTKIGVVGTGVTGSGISMMAIISGCRVIIRGRSEKSLQNVFGKLEKNLSKRMSVKKLKNVMDSITLTTDMKKLSDTDLVIEAVKEDIDVKCSIFKELDSVCSKHTILATNTSSLSIDEIAKATDNPERVIGMHFFNPIHRMRLVEIVYGSMTSQAAIESVKRAVSVLGKTPVLVKNSTGFIVNRLLMTFINEAVRVLEEQQATKEDIDKAIELGLNHPMGPLKVLDLIGIDVFHDIMVTLRNYRPDRFQIPQTIEKMLENKTLGRKTGEGFYRYQKQFKGEQPSEKQYAYSKC